MTLNEIQDYLEGRIQIEGNRDTVPGVRDERPAAGGASATVRSTFELDPMHIIHK